MFIGETGYKMYFAYIQIKGTLLDGLNLNKKMNENIYPFYLILHQRYFGDFIGLPHHDAKDEKVTVESTEATLK